jgi:hypothetical protein
MTQNVFLEKSKQPTPVEISKHLGTRMRYLTELQQHITGDWVPEWKYYGQKLGWTMKLLVGKRNLCFIVVCKGYFAVSMVFGDKAVRAVEDSSLPAELISELVQARRYAEGRGIRIEVKSRTALGHAKTLLEIKQTT